MDSFLSNKVVAPWEDEKRFRVNELVEQDGVVWRNVTGINTDPSLNDGNWTFESQQLVKDKVKVNGNLFNLVKHPDNNDPLNRSLIEVNDVIRDGWWDVNTYWPTAIYLGGGVDVQDNWEFPNAIEEIPLN